jgi:type I restriction enzyme S subunit
MSLGSRQGWEEVGLLQYAELVPSGVRRFTGVRKYVDTGSLETGRILDGIDVDFGSRPSRANMEAQVDDVLFAKMKATEKVYLISGGDKNKIYSTGFSILRAKDKSRVLPKFLFYWLRSKHFQQWKDRESSGATQKAISEGKLRRSTVLLPPVSVQERIASTLEKLDKAANLREEANKLLNIFLSAIFYQTFGDPAASPVKFPTIRIGTLSEVKTGGNA